MPSPNPAAVDWLMHEYELGVLLERKNPAGRLMFSILPDSPHSEDGWCEEGRCRGTSDAAHSAQNVARGLVPKHLWAAEGLS